MDRQFWVGVGVGAGIVASAGLIAFLGAKSIKSDSDKQWSNKEIKESVLELIGHTPMLRIASLSDALGVDIFLKLENQNPGRSNKDRAAMHILQGIIKKHNLPVNKKTGKLHIKDSGKKCTVYEGTSGNTGISLGLVSNYIGFNSSIFLNDDLANEKYQALEVCGCKLNKVRPVSYIDGGHFVKRAQASALADESGYYSDQFNNPDNTEGHLLETGKEILDQMKGDMDYFVMGAGTGASINGISNYLAKASKKKVNVVLADPAGSSLYNWAMCGTLFTHEDRDGHKKRHIRRTMVEGIGLNWLCKNLEGAKIDHAEKIADVEALNIARYMIRHEGLLVGSTTAVNLAAVVKTCKRFNLKGKRIVTVCCDDGFRHITKFYNREKWKDFGFEYVEYNIEDPRNLDFISVEKAANENA